MKKKEINKIYSTMPAWLEIYAMGKKDLYVLHGIPCFNGYVPFPSPIIMSVW
jgi:hypothetical protein